MLARAGITTVEQLRALGAVPVFLAVTRTGAPARLNLLWTLEGALSGEDWKTVARLHCASLLIALDEVERAA